MNLDQPAAALDADTASPELAAAEVNLAAMLISSGDTKGAREKLEKVMPALRHLANRQPRRYASLLAKALGLLAQCFHRLGARTEAAYSMFEAASVWRNLVSLVPDKFEPNLLRALHSVAFFFFMNKEPIRAISARREIAAILGAMANADPKAYGSDWLTALENIATLGVSYMDRRAKIAALHELLHTSKALMDQFPGQFVADRVRILTVVAEEIRNTNIPLNRKSLLREARQLRVKMVSRAIFRALRLAR